MQAHALLSEIDPSWLAGEDEPALPDALRCRAAASALGRRVLLRSLAATSSRLFVPATTGSSVSPEVMPWSRERLVALMQDLGALGYAPAIRSEIGRDSVRRLKQVLGEGYLLALERSVWDAVVDDVTDVLLTKELGQAMVQGDEAMRALFISHGRAEFHAWAATQAPALAELDALLRPRTQQAPNRSPHLPAAAIERVHAYHLRHAQAA